MDFEKYSRGFTLKAEDSGFSADNINKCLEYAKPLLDKNLPVIYNSSHLASLVGYNQAYLRRAVIFTRFFYRNFSIRKSNGTFRSISEPLPSLLEIQTWILTQILYQIKPSKFAKAYIPGIGLKQNLVFHREQPIVVNLDIRDFFSSIRRQKIEKLFRQAGYSIYVSALLGKICCLNECLPQGAPTSAYLSNLFMIDFDLAISEYCQHKGIRYTRYADDLTFSGDFVLQPLIDIVKNELKKHSLSLNETKTKVMRQSHRQTATGIVVNKKIQVVRHKRKKLRQILYFIKRYGLEEHMRRINCQKTNYLLHLIGQVQFVLLINPEDEEFKEYRRYLHSLKEKR